MRERATLTLPRGDRGYGTFASMADGCGRPTRPVKAKPRTRESFEIELEISPPEASRVDCPVWVILRFDALGVAAICRELMAVGEGQDALQALSSLWREAAETIRQIVDRDPDDLSDDARQFRESLLLKLR